MGPTMIINNRTNGSATSPIKISKTLLKKCLYIKLFFVFITIRFDLFTVLDFFQNSLIVRKCTAYNFTCSYYDIVSKRGSFHNKFVCPNKTPFAKINRTPLDIFRLLKGVTLTIGYRTKLNINNLTITPNVYIIAIVIEFNYTVTTIFPLWYSVAATLLCYSADSR